MVLVSSTTTRADVITATATTQADVDSSLLDELKLDDEMEKPVKKYACRQCTQRFGTTTALKSHLESHKLLKSLMKTKQKKRKGRAAFSKGAAYRNRCKHCDKKFLKPSQCTRHERIHTGEKPFKVSRFFNSA